MLWTVLIMGVMVVVFYFVLKGQNFQGNIFNYLVMFAILFFIFTLGYVYVNNSVDLTSYDGLMDFGGIYFSWLGQIAKNFVRITGYAVNQDWSLNATNSTGG